MVVYLDILLLTNLWVDYAMLQTAAHLTHTPLKRRRGLAAAGLGAAGALVIFLPPMHPALSVLLRILTALLMGTAAFGCRSLKLLSVQTSVLFGVSALFCGVISALSVPQVSQNGILYADLSLTVLLAGSGLAAVCTVLWDRRHNRMRQTPCRLHLRIAQHDFLLPAFCDTGNMLCDVFTGRPVIVCPAEMLCGWLSGFHDTAGAAQSRRGFRMLPVHTVTGTSLLPAFLPDSAALTDTAEQNGAERPLDVLIALTDASGDRAIVPANIF